MADNWSLIVGFFLPPVLAIILRCAWPDDLKAVIAFLICIVAGLGTAYYGGDLTLSGGSFDAISGDVMKVLIASMASYKAFWKPTGIAPAINKATG